MIDNSIEPNEKYIVFSSTIFTIERTTSYIEYTYDYEPKLKNGLNNHIFSLRSPTKCSEIFESYMNSSTQILVLGFDWSCNFEYETYEFVPDILIYPWISYSVFLTAK